MATTPNYGWVTPAPTDLVTDLPADFDTFGQGVDTRLKALNPETTTGDLAYQSATANTKTRLALGTAGQILAVNSGATAPEWINNPAGGMTLLSTTAITAANEISITGISQSYNELVIVLSNAASVSTGVELRMTFNTTTTAATYSSLFLKPGVIDGSRSMPYIQLVDAVGNVASTNNITGTFRITRYTDTTPLKTMHYQIGYTQQTSGTLTITPGFGLTKEAAAIQSVQIKLSTGNFVAQGNIYIYGVK